MRAVLQRVKSASVEVSAAAGWLAGWLPAKPAVNVSHTPPTQVDGSIVSRIGQGWLCLVGLTDEDTDADADFV